MGFLVLIVSVAMGAASAEATKDARAAAYRAERAAAFGEPDNADAQLRHFAKGCGDDAGCLAWIGIGQGLKTLTLLRAGEGASAAAREPERNCERSRETFRSIGDRDGEAAATFCVAQAVDLQERHDHAVKEARKAVDLAQGGPRDTLGRARNTLFQVHGNAGRSLQNTRPAEALSHFQAALRVAEELGSYEGKARVLNRICTLQLALGSYRDALDSCKRTIKNARPQGGERLATAIHNYGVLHDALGQKDKAREYYLAAIPLREVPAGVVASRFAVATLAMSGGDDSAALRELEAARRVAEQAGLEKERGFLLKEIGAIHARAGNAPLARASYDRALEASRAAGDPRGEAGALLGLARLDEKSGDRKTALERCERALLLDRETGSREGEASALKELASLLREAEPARAVFHAKQGVEIYQQLRRDLPPHLQRTYGEARSEGYRALAELLVEQDRLAEAEEVLALLKDEEFFEFTRGDGAPGGGEPVAFVRPEQQVKARDDASKNRIAALWAEHARLRAVEKRTPEQEARLRELEPVLGAEQRAYASFLRDLNGDLGKEPDDDTANSRISGIRAALLELESKRPGTVAVYTVAGERTLRTILVAVDPRPDARALYRVVVGPIQAELEAANARTVLWFLDGPLRYVPIAALHDGGAWLAERFANVVMTGKSLTSMLGDSQGPWTVLGLGVTKAHGSFKALPGVQRELRAIVRQDDSEPGLMPGRRRIDEEFTRKDLVDAVPGKWSVIHVASHFSFNPGPETESYLLLGDGRLLTLQELRLMQTGVFDKVKLLVLSACETGVVAGPGAEVDGLARVAESQGAEAVLATLWKVSDSSTPALMRRFYQLRGAGARAAGPCSPAASGDAAARGVPKAEALRAAQCEMAKGSLGPGAEDAAARRGMSVPGQARDAFPGWTHPFYWAPFVLLGNGT